MFRRASIAALVAVAATVAVVVPAAPAHARACLPDHYCYTDYYTDDSHTIKVGDLYEDCEGSAHRWGAYTGFKVFAEYRC
ncbi:hypothetical protein AB0M43_09620 [Longispora sp. NPDC051575]|uniref:hypothetical protein n=1 Tax=Longispora sp. NPDC051575 TaxID=3154943 RepID=UPI00342BF07C